MTLLVSERSLMIRTKFRSVLQLRLQHRRTREQLAEQGIMPPLKSPSHFFGQSRGLDEVKTEDFTKHKMQNRLERSKVVEMDILQDGASSPSWTGLKRPRLADDLSEKTLHRPGPLELMDKNILPLDSGVDPACDVGGVGLPEGSEPLASEDEGSSSHSASPEVPGSRQAQAEPPLGPLQIPATFSIGEDNPTVPGPGDPAGPNPSMAPPVMRVNKSLRHKRPKDSKPKVRKLKYHQYIPPDQKPDRIPVPMDAAYSRLLQQQQIFLQLQILNQQQQQPISFQPIQPGTPGVPPEQIIGFASTVPAQLPCIPLSPLGRSCQRLPSAVCVKPELLPANLDDLTVSELRQQLRKRGLPVSGTKPALLERLRPFRAPGQRPAPPHPVERPSPGPEDASLAEKERVIERLTRRLQQEQHQAEGLWEELELRKRQQQQQMPLAPPAGEFGAAPSPPSTGPHSIADSGLAEGSPPAAVSLQHRSEDRGFSGLLVPRPVELEFPYSPSSLHSFFTLEDTELEARNHSSSDENFDSEVFLCDSLGSEDRQYSSLETFSSTDSRGFQSLEDELTEAIKTAELSQSQSIEDILEEQLMSSGSSQSLECCFPESAPESAGSCLDYPKEVGGRPGVGCTREGGGSPAAGGLLAGLPPYGASEGRPAPPGPPSPPPGPGAPGGGGGLSPATFDPADWIDPLPDASPGGFPAEFLDAPDLNINRMIDLLVEQW